MTLTPKEKAKYLFSSYLYEFNEDFKNRWLAKQCALIAVDELIKQCWDYRDIDLEKSCDYWKEVKQEILAL
jgi:hypothetical protein